MTEERHNAVLTWRKATLWVLVVLCLLELLQKDSVLNAVWLFCTAGVVPWRKQPLAPDTVLLILAGCVGLVILVVLVRVIVKTVRRRRGRVPKLHTERTLATEALQTEKSQARFVGEDPATIPALPEAAAQMPRSPLMPVVIMKPRAKKSFSAMPLLRLGAYAIAYAVWIMHFLEAMARMAARWCINMGVKAARWLLPRLWQFDAWLEKQMRTYLATAQKKAKKHQKLQDIALFGRESRHVIAARLTVVRSTKNEHIVRSTEP